MLSEVGRKKHMKKCINSFYRNEITTFQGKRSGLWNSVSKMIQVLKSSRRQAGVSHFKRSFCLKAIKKVENWKFRRRRRKKSFWEKTFKNRIFQKKGGPEVLQFLNLYQGGNFSKDFAMRWVLLSKMSCIVFKYFWWETPFGEAFSCRAYQL